MKENEIKLELVGGWEMLPQCWRNFVSEFQSIKLTADEREGAIRDKLAEFNATRTYHESGWGYYGVLVFNTPADKTWFLLRWS